MLQLTTYGSLKPLVLRRFLKKYQKRGLLLKERILFTIIYFITLQYLFFLMRTFILLKILQYEGPEKALVHGWERLKRGDSLSPEIGNSNDGNALVYSRFTEFASLEPRRKFSDSKTFNGEARVRGKTKACNKQNSEAGPKTMSERRLRGNFSYLQWPFQVHRFRLNRCYSKSRGHRLKSSV